MDTNVISEVARGRRCHPSVAAWWSRAGEESLYVSTMTLGEIRRGVEAVRPRDPSKAARLEAWLLDVTQGFADRVIPVDARVADAWGRMAADRSRPVVDTLIAATAQVHGLVLVTRNAADMRDLGVAVLNPFEA